MVVLPDGEEILDVLCGDRDFWVISATHNIAHVKPAKAGAETNLNLVTSSGTIYSFMLSEKSSPPDLKVYVQGEPGGTSGKPKYYSAAQVEALESQIAELRASARDEARKLDEAVAAYRQQYPTRLQFPYGVPKYEKPFFVRSMWHDGAVHIREIRRHRTARALRAQRWQAIGRQLSGSRGHLRRAEGARSWLSGAWLHSVSRSSSRGDDHARRTWHSRNGACQRSSAGPSRSAAARLSDVADGRPRARHRADHPDHRSA